ncbi:MAG: hypothetical protein KC619_29525 [Myxococcales bacterium]|nr:hypothetical protein [Myxococcales bacterium]
MAAIPGQEGDDAAAGGAVDFCHTGTGLPRLWQYRNTYAYDVLGVEMVHLDQSGTCADAYPDLGRLLIVDAGRIAPARVVGDVPAYEFWGGMGVSPPVVRSGGRPTVPPLFQILFGEDPLRTEPSYPLVPSSRVDFAGSLRVFPSGWQLGNVLDSVELLCEAAAAGSVASSGACSLDAVPTSISTSRDVDRSVGFLECAANDIQARAEGIVFSDLPAHATDALRQQSSVGTYPALGGAYAQNVTELRSALIELTSIPGMMAAEIRSNANDLDQFRVQVERIANERELSELRLISSISSELTNCLVSALNGNWANPSTYFITGIQCVNSAVQIMVAVRADEIAAENAELDERSAVYQFRERFFSRVTALQQHATRLQLLLERVDSALAAASTLRGEARAAMSQALFLGSDEAGVHAIANRATRNRYNLTRVRYERAREDAVRMAFIAKRAIEQRLGMPLASMRDDMSLVEAPARWEARVCELTGVDYNRLRDETALDVDSFADEFIGDYVRRLERVVQSYQLDYPFTDSADTAVISLRDDVQNVRGWCETPTNNLLYEAGQLDIPLSSETGADVWTAEGCTVDEPNCVVATRVLEGDMLHEVTPFLISSPELEDQRAMRVYFGNPDGSTCSGATCGMTTSTTLGQAVDLPPGRYRISWYGALAEAGVLDPANAIDVVDSGSSTLLSGTPEVDPMTCAECGMGWTRYWEIFDVPSTDTIRVQVVPNVGGGAVSQAVDLAGLMLEDVSDRVINPPGGSYDPAEHRPGIFENTHASLSRFQRTCEDTTGAEFRSRGWRRNCVRLCAEGFGRGCETEAASSYCYWETSFTITQRDIEHGRTFHNAGFARGNYNYRLDTVAVNVVGTGVRDCSESELPTSCYAGAFIPYTLEHVGPYTVRNVLGDDYEAPLFTASIEHGRALGAERHVTNPLSSADRALIEPYTHTSLRGRPIDGTYVLRIWDEPGVDFNQIEDVQVVMGYRYWTRSR